jgi:hypothetical protein
LEVLEELRPPTAKGTVQRTAGSDVGQAEPGTDQTTDARTERQRYIAPDFPGSTTARAFSFRGGFRLLRLDTRSFLGL